jgi:hypothetical protein
MPFSDYDADYFLGDEADLAMDRLDTLITAADANQNYESSAVLECQFDELIELTNLYRSIACVEEQLKEHTTAILDGLDFEAPLEAEPSPFA